MEKEWEKNAEMESMKTLCEVVKVLGALHDKKDAKKLPMHPIGRLPSKIMTKIYGHLIASKKSWMPQRPKYLGPRLIITTPGVIIQSTGSGILRKATPHFEAVILDEAHMIRNASLIGNEATSEKSDSDKQGSKISQNVFELVSRSKFCMAITGTPLVNREGEGANPRHFFHLESRSERLTKWSEDYVLRRRKQTVAQLPDKFLHTYTLHVSQSEVDHNKKWSNELSNLMAQYRDSEKNGEAIAKNAISKKILGVLTRMRQLCVSPCLYRYSSSDKDDSAQNVKTVDLSDWLSNPEDGDKDNHPITRLFQDCMKPKFKWDAVNASLRTVYEDSIKLRTAITDIYRLTNGGPTHHQQTPPSRPYNGARVVVVSSQFVRALELIGCLLKSQEIFGLHRQYASRQPRILIYHGSMSHTQREETLQIARNAKEPTVLLLSFLSGNVGVNLMFDEKNEILADDPIAQSEGKTQHLYQIDPWWNKAMMNQLFDRIHRLTQTRPVHIHQVINSATIEEYMLQLQHSKHAKAMEFIGVSGEKVFAGLQHDMYKAKNGGKFTLKGAVDHLLNVRDVYSKNSNLSRITEKMRVGFRDPNIYTVNVDKEIEKIGEGEEDQGMPSKKQKSDAKEQGIFEVFSYSDDENDEDQYGQRPMDISPPVSHDGFLVGDDYLVVPNSPNSVDGLFHPNYNGYNTQNAQNTDNGMQKSKSGLLQSIGESIFSLFK
jgi:hypothetical protein